MIVTTIQKLDPATVPPRIQIAIANRLDRMLKALGNVPDSEAPGILSLACRAEIASMAQEMAQEYEELVDAGLRNGKCGLSDDQVIAGAHEISLGFQSSLISTIDCQMEENLAGGISGAALAACYGSIVWGIMISMEQVHINLVVPGRDSTKTTRTIESRKVVMQ